MIRVRIQIIGGALVNTALNFRVPYAMKLVILRPETVDLQRRLKYSDFDVAEKSVMYFFCYFEEKCKKTSTRKLAQYGIETEYADSKAGWLSVLHSDGGFVIRDVGLYFAL